MYAKKYIMTTNSSSIIRISKKFVKKVYYNNSAYYNELSMLNNLTPHENIISIHNNYLDEFGKGVIEFKYYKDGDLLSFINKYVRTKKKCFTKEKKIIMFKKMVETISYCHDLNIVHGDIKPDNFLLDKHTPILIDFGISVYNPKFTDYLFKNPIIYNRTQGSPGYIAPELSDNYIGPCSDVFSLGVILYELFTNEKPYFDKQTIEIDSNTLFTHDIPHTIDNLLHDMLQIDYNRRPTLEDIYYYYEL